MDAIRILHTSDVHIGASFEFLGRRGEEQRQTVRETFERITRLAREGEYHALLVAGDLFDDAYAATDRDITFIVNCLAGIGPLCRVVILPGSHDHWAPGSVYEREQERFEAAGNVALITPEHGVVVIAECSLAVHGTALTSPHVSSNLVAGLRPEQEMRWNVAIAHGAVAGASADYEPEENPISMDELREGFDYLALGHWHSFRIIREHAPPAVYSGAPELIARDQVGAGSVVSLTLSGGGAAFERIPVGFRRIESTSVECRGLGTTEALVSRILGTVPANRNLVLDITLSGVLDAEAVIDPGLVLEMLEEHYFSVRFSGEPPEREISREVILEVPEETVAGSFVRLLLERIDRADGEERERLKEALQVGYQLFRGRNPLG